MNTKFGHVKDTHKSRTMLAHITFVIFLITFGCASSAFISTPKDISPMRTKDVTLRCEPQLENIMTLLAMHIWRKSDYKTGSTPSGENQQENGDQDDLKTESPQSDANLIDNVARRKRSSDDFVRVTMTAGNNIDIVPPITRFTAEGNIQKPTYLSVTINNPGVKDTGLYECQITFLDKTGNVKTTSELTQIREVVELTLEDLESRVQQLEEDRQSYSAAIAEMQKIVKSCAEFNNDIQQDVEALQTKTDNILGAIGDLQKEVKNGGSSGGQAGKAVPRRGDKQIPVDELERLNTRIDQLMTNQLQNLAKKLMTVQDKERETQKRVYSVELAILGPVEKRLKKLESMNWQGLSESLDDMEMKTLPLIMLNVSEAQKNVADLKYRVTACCGERPETTEAISPSSSPETTPTTTTVVTIPTYTEPACFTCGNNITEEHCTVDMITQTSLCPKHQPFCITDVYQDGITRHVYKRCASESVCQEDKAKSSAICSTENFMESKVMECHYCCNSILCNSSLRPPKDLL